MTQMHADKFKNSLLYLRASASSAVHSLLARATFDRAAR